MYGSSTVSVVKSNAAVIDCGNVWKSLWRILVGKISTRVMTIEYTTTGKLGACSGCPGDYEDPDRSAWPDDHETDDAGGDDHDAPDEFPVRHE